MIRKILFAILLGVFFSLTLEGCKDPDPYPRPKAYPRINLEEAKLTQFKNSECPFEFNYPNTGVVIPVKQDSCIFDIYFKEHDYYWHITYRDIPESGKKASEHHEEYRRLVMSHISKLSHLQENDLETEEGYGTQYRLYGNVGTPASMVFGNSEHLLMMSFYFSKVINQDSLLPLIKQVERNMGEMANSIRWK